MGSTQSIELDERALSRVKNGTEGLARFLSAYDDSLAQKIVLSIDRWRRRVSRGAIDQKEAWDQMRATIRALPYDESGINMRVIVDEKKRKWRIITFYDRRWGIIIRRVENGHTEGEI